MQKIKFFNVNVILPSEIILNGAVIVENGRIVGVEHNNVSAEAVEIDGQGLYLAPGFVDLHVHGGGGCDFMDGTIEAYKIIIETHLKHGTTSLLPTIIPNSIEETLEMIRLYQKAKYQVKGNCLGLHLEGPYVSENQIGALNPSSVKDPDPLEYLKILEVAGDDIIRWSIAPERCGAIKLGQHLSKNNILPSIAHSDATYEKVLEAYDNGFSMITHLYSAMSTIRRFDGYRVPGVLESAFLIEDMNVEIIADGCHIPNSLLTFVYKFKDKKHIALTSDAMRAAGQSVKTSVLGNLDNGLNVIIEDGVAKMLDRSGFAGSVATGDRLVRTMIGTGVPLIEAVNMASNYSINMLKKNISKGQIRCGMDADLILFDQNINVKMAMVCGRIVHCTENLAKYTISDMLW